MTINVGGSTRSTVPSMAIRPSGNRYSYRVSGCQVETTPVP
jgi:hypothetical protein